MKEKVFKLGDKIVAGNVKGGIRGEITEIVGETITAKTKYGSVFTASKKVTTHQ